MDEAIAACRKALELRPQQPNVHSLLARVYLAQGHPAEALAEIEREPQIIFRLQGLALAQYALGHTKESDAALTELIQTYHADWAYQIAEVYAYRGQTDHAFEWLERAYAQHDSGLTEMKGDALLKNLWPDSRYAAFLKKMRLPT